jgi:hypothetical protein
VADSPVFGCICDELESQSSLDRLEARGTVRLLLKTAGLTANSVTRSQAGVAIGKLLPDELTARGVTDPDAVCRTILSALGRIDDTQGGDSPEAVFARLGGN